MAEQTAEKPFWQSNKVTFAAMIVLVVLGTVLPLAILGKLTVTSEQVFGFGEWLFTTFVGGHSVQRVAAILKSTPAAAPAAAPPTGSGTEPVDEEDEGDEEDVEDARGES